MTGEASEVLERKIETTISKLESTDPPEDCDIGAHVADALVVLLQCKQIELRNDRARDARSKRLAIAVAVACVTAALSLGVQARDIVLAILKAI